MLFDGYDYGDEESDSDLDDQSSSSTLMRAKFASILIASLIGLFGFTLSANISLGSSSKEFGQGIQMATACDPEISSSPITTFRNDSQTPTYVFSGIKVSGVSQNCKDKLFVVKIYGETGTALNLNGNAPRTALKFHFGNSGWNIDVQGCFSYSNASSNSTDTNEITIKNDDSCVNSQYWNQWFSASNKVSKYTIETRENTVKQVDINYQKGDGRTFGYVMDTGDEGATNGHVPNMTNFRMYLDTLKTNYLSIYFEITQTEFNSGAAAASLFNVNANNGNSCNFAGVVSVGTNSHSPGVDTGYYWSTLRSAEYVCKVSSPTTITVS